MDGYGDWRLGAPQLDPKVQEMAKLLARPNAQIPEQNGYWQQTWPGAESVTIHPVDQNPYKQEGIQGWTVCDKDKRTCQIMILKNAPRDCVEAHERKHAAGYDHPNHPSAFTCPTQ